MFRQYRTGGTGGLPFTATATLPTPTPGASVTFSSSNPSLLKPYWASVPVSGGTTAYDIIYTYPVSTNTFVQLTATYNGGSMTRQFLLVPGGLTDLTVPAALNSNASTTGSVTISGMTTVGIVISLKSNSPDLVVPGSATVPAGSTTITFPITTGTIASGSTATVTATFGDVTIKRTVSLSP